MKYPETAKRLTYIMALRKITAQELSRRSGVGKSSISHYVNGSNEPHNKNAGALSEVLKCDPRWLMGFDVPMEAATKEKEPSQEDGMRYRVLMLYMEKLNISGMKKLEERAEELSEIPKYKKALPDDHSESAH